jgi:hypothetical protein
MASLVQKEYSEHSDREQRYLDEAKKHLKEAEARLKTSFTKWKADYLMAGPEFAKAGNSYRLGKEPKLAVDCYMKAATCAEKSGQSYEIGKYQDLAAQILSKSTDKADKIQAAELYEATMNVFMGMEDFMGGATACKKAVSIWSKLDPERAVTMNRGVIDQLEAVGKGTYALEMYRETITLAIKAERWTMAGDMIKKAIVGFVDAGRPPRAIYSWHLSEIIVLAKIGDNVALDETFLESLSTSGYGTSDEAEVAEEINRGLKERDTERLNKVLGLRGMKNGLLPVIVNLAKSMWKLADEGETNKQREKKTSSVGSNNRAGNVGPTKKAGQRVELFGGGGSGSSSSGSNNNTKNNNSSGDKTTLQTSASATTKAPAPTSAPATETDDMDDLMDGLDDLMTGLPEADEDDDDLL